MEEVSGACYLVMAVHRSREAFAAQRRGFEVFVASQCLLKMPAGLHASFYARVGSDSDRIWRSGAQEEASCDVWLTEHPIHRLLGFLVDVLYLYIARLQQFKVIISDVSISSPTRTRQ